MAWPKGIPRSEEHQKKISEGLSLAYKEGRRKRKHSAETIAKLERFQRARAASPEYVSPTQKYKNGDKYICPRYGYVMVYTPGHYRRNSRFVPEHRLIAERVMKRRLKRHEVVHHINGVKVDNRNENLLICDSKYHAELHQRMAFLYQQEHFMEKP